jgi:hypothetical protein
MTINTNFNKDDIVYFLSAEKNCICMGKVKSLSMQLGIFSDEAEIKYIIEWAGDKPLHLPENRLFKTSQAIISYLKNNIIEL